MTPFRIFISSVQTEFVQERAAWGVMQNFEIRLPQVKEQSAIATVLSDIDAEIAALERCRDKTRTIK